MKELAIILFATAALCAGTEWNSFQVTYGEPGYYDLPWTVGEATEHGKWKKVKEERDLNVDVYTQENDPHVMLLFDSHGNIAGIRMAVLKEHMDKKAKEGGYHFDIDYDNNPLWEKGTFWGKDLYYHTILFQNPRTLAAGGRHPINRDKDDVAEGIYFKHDGKWTELNRDECKYDKNLFEEASCYSGMGVHYPLKNANEDDCAHRQSFIALYDQGRLSGFVLSGFGDFVRNPNTQSYYENFPVSALRTILPNAHSCVEEYGRKFGLTNMHVYLTKNASKVSCPTQKWSSKC